MKKTGKISKTPAMFLASALVLTPLFLLSDPGYINANAAISNADMIVGFALSRTGMGGSFNEALDHYNMTGQNIQWDAIFVYYCADVCGAGSIFPDSAVCDSSGHSTGGVGYFMEKGQWQYSRALNGSYTPKKGDVVYFDWDHDQIADHVGFVTSFSSQYIHTIEGDSNDFVRQNSYTVGNSSILGFGTPDYDSIDPEDVTPPTFPDISSGTKYKVTSAEGCWLRSDSDFRDNRIGILSTDQIVTVDKTDGNWLHIVNTTVEGSSTVVSGWAHSMNLRPVSGNAPEVSEPQTPVTPDPPAQGNTSYDEYVVSSSIGAWVRSSPDFYDSSRIGIIDTGTAVRVYSIDDGWAKAAYSTDGGQTYQNGYIHISTISAAGKGDNKPVNRLYHVTSPIGCKFRSTADLTEASVVAILDTWQTFEVIEAIDNGWLYVRVLLDGNYVYGYIHSSNVEPV